MNQRERIIQVSAGLMRKNGYKGATLQSIADRVGVRQSTLFYYFKNKEQILLAVIDIAYEDFKKAIRQIIEDKNRSAEEKLRMVITTHVGILVEDFDSVNVFNSETRSLSPDIRKRYLAMRRDYATDFERLVIEIMELEGSRFKGLDPTVVTNAILGMCNGVGRWYKEGVFPEPRKIADTFCRLIALDNTRPEAGKGRKP